MAITDTFPEITYTIGASTTGPFAVPFEFTVDGDLAVYLFVTGDTPADTDLLTLDTDYTVTGAGEDDGGTLTLVVAAASKSLRIARVTLLERSSDFPGSGPLNTAVLNDELDRLMAICQELRRETTLILADLTPIDYYSDDVVRTHVVQSLTAGEKLTARTNIGLSNIVDRTGGVDVTGDVVATDDGIFAGDLSAVGAVTAASASISADLAVGGDATVGDDLTATGDILGATINTWKMDATGATNSQNNITANQFKFQFSNGGSILHLNGVGYTGSVGCLISCFSDQESGTFTSHRDRGVQSDVTYGRIKSTNPAPLELNDALVGIAGKGTVNAAGTQVLGGQFQFIVSESTATILSGGYLGTRALGQLVPVGSATRNSVWEWSNEYGLRMFGNTVVFNASGTITLVSKTVATLPAATTVGQMFWVTDLGGAAGPVVSDGTNWRRLGSGGQTAVNTDGDYTVNILDSAQDTKNTATLTANRTVTVSATYAYDGARMRHTRTGSGAFTLSIGGLILLAQNQWCETTYDGSAWYLSAYGELSAACLLSGNNNLTGGFTCTSLSQGTKSSGTFTPSMLTGAVQHYTNGGAHTLAPPTGHGSVTIDITNNASAGAITTSGFTKVDGDPFDTTNTHAFRCYITVGNLGSHMSVMRMV